jgi:hypothetical protein
MQFFLLLVQTNSMVSMDRRLSCIFAQAWDAISKNLVLWNELAIEAPGGNGAVEAHLPRDYFICPWTFALVFFDSNRSSWLSSLAKWLSIDEKVVKNVDN